MQSRRNKDLQQLKQDQNNNNVIIDKSDYHKSAIYYRYGLNRVFSEFLWPLLTLVMIPVLSLLIWYICAKCDGSVLVFYKNLSKYSTVYDVIYEIYLKRLVLTKFSLITVLAFFIWAIAATIFLPGETYNGSVTINGNIPTYKDNGFLYHVVTSSVFFIIAISLELFTPYSVASIYDRYDEIIVALNFIGFVFCWFLYFKGIFFPSFSDNSSTGNVIFDYYWGTELHPRIFDIDVKLITNCRFGMSAWYLIVIIFCWKCFKVNGYTDSVLVTTLLIGLYLTKFFYWESGYMKTMDIALDRAGFYICYGCICWVPSFYTLPAMYLANHPVQLGFKLALIIFLCGLLSLYVNYDADRQKQLVRATNGNCLIWGKKPNIIEAKCQLLDGTKSTSLLLVSGYWGISRHFHYIPEITLSFFWSVTALFNNIVPYFYVFFLILLLTHRSIRDDNKCTKKYGNYWNDYKKLVPYKIVPYIF